MQPQHIITVLGKNKKVFQNLLESVAPVQYTFKSDLKTWCLLEVICHLLDEEVEDFRARVKHVLFYADEPLKPIRPEIWPKERNYLEQDFNTVLRRFLEERQQSLDWLLSLKHANWDNAIVHPELGRLSASKFLVNWLAHDYHHIRQINRINHAYLKYASGDDLTYAGKW